jgi:hypothetical protein
VRGIDGEQIRSRSISEGMSEEDEGGRKEGRKEGRRVLYEGFKRC